MSFGLSAADIAGALKLTVQAYKAWRGAPKEYADVTRELRSMRGILEQAQQDARPPSTLCVGSRDKRREWRDLMGSCSAVAAELHQIVKDHEDIKNGERGRKVWSRIRLSAKATKDLKARTMHCKISVTSFLSDATFKAVRRIEDKVDDINALVEGMPNLETAVHELRASQPREASVMTANSEDDTLFWRQFRRDLKAKYDLSGRTLNQYAPQIMEHLHELARCDVFGPTQLKAPELRQEVTHTKPPTSRRHSKGKAKLNVNEDRSSERARLPEFAQQRPKPEELPNATATVESQVPGPDLTLANDIEDKPSLTPHNDSKRPHAEDAAERPAHKCPVIVTGLADDPIQLARNRPDEQADNENASPNRLHLDQEGSFQATCEEVEDEYPPKTLLKRRNIGDSNITQTSDAQRITHDPQYRMQEPRDQTLESAFNAAVEADGGSDLMSKHSQSLDPSQFHAGLWKDQPPVCSSDDGSDLAFRSSGVADNTSNVGLDGWSDEEEELVCNCPEPEKGHKWRCEHEVEPCHSMDNLAEKTDDDEFRQRQQRMQKGLIAHIGGQSQAQLYETVETEMLSDENGSEAEPATEVESVASNEADAGWKPPESGASQRKQYTDNASPPPEGDVTDEVLRGLAGWEWLPDEDRYQWRPFDTRPTCPAPPRPPPGTEAGWRWVPDKVVSAWQQQQIGKSEKRFTWMRWRDSEPVVCGRGPEGQEIKPHTSSPAKHYPTTGNTYEGPHRPAHEGSSTAWYPPHQTTSPSGAPFGPHDLPTHHYPSFQSPYDPSNGYSAPYPGALPGAYGTPYGPPPTNQFGYPYYNLYTHDTYQPQIPSGYTHGFGGAELSARPSVPPNQGQGFHFSSPEDIFARFFRDHQGASS